MNKKVVKSVLIVVFMAIVFLSIYNIYTYANSNVATLSPGIINDPQDETSIYNKDEGNVAFIISIIYSEIIEELQILFSKVASIILIISVVTIIIICLGMKFPKFRTFIKHIINIINFIFVFEIFTAILVDNCYHPTGIRDYSFGFYLFTLAVCLIVYIAWAPQLNRKMFKTSVSIIITGIVFALFFALAFAINLFGMRGIIFLIIALIGLILILATIFKINERKKLKFDKQTKKISTLSLYILKYIGALIVSIFIGNGIEIIMFMFMRGISIPVTIIGIYIFNYLFNELYKKENEIKENEEIKKTSFIFYIILIFAEIGVLTFGSYIVKIMTSVVSNGII